jgi:bifunctional non-homologous end joining protein LigD
MRDRLVRQASFKGLREDKPAREVVLEMPVPLQSAEETAKKSARRSAKAGHGEDANRRERGARGRSAKKLESTMPAQFNITHPEKVLDRASGLTKQALAEYYFAVAERMLPHVAGRPLSVLRCPEGSDKPCFFQKHVGRGLPEGVDSIAVPNRKTGKEEEFLTLNSAEGLVGLAQMGVLEVHPWGSRNEALDWPDRIVFDLDPDPAVPFPVLAAIARALRQRLEKFKPDSFLKSTGGKGLHVVAPVEPGHEWETIKRFAHALVLELEAQDPKLYITRASKAERRNRIFLDYLRNDREATSVAPFSPRARSGAPVAMTLKWSELEMGKMPAFRVADFAQWRKRLARDPWKDMLKVKQRLNAEALRAAESAMRRR